MTNVKWILPLIALMTLVPPALCSAAPAMLITTEPVYPVRYYPWLDFLSKGPFHEFSDPVTMEIHGRSYRVAIVDDPDEPALFIEETRSGRDGCCTSLWLARHLNLAQLMAQAGIAGQNPSVQFIRWVSETSFEFTLAGKGFCLSHIGEDQVSVSRIQKTLPNPTEPIRRDQ